MELLIFQLVVLIFSVVIHEISHGFVAERLGDPTARLAGRLTLNPLKHLDFFGSFILPFSLFFISQGGFIFGWAKPVPYNPFNLRNPERGGGIIAAAGPLSNIFLAFVFGMVYRAISFSNLSGAWFLVLADLFRHIVAVNIVLAIFNLVPLPPLDGSKILFSFLPQSAYKIKLFLEQYGLFLFLLFIFFGFQLINPIILTIYRLIIGG